MRRGKTTVVVATVACWFGIVGWAAAEETRRTPPPANQPVPPEGDSTAPVPPAAPDPAAGGLPATETDSDAPAASDSDETAGRSAARGAESDLPGIPPVPAPDSEVSALPGVEPEAGEGTDEEQGPVEQQPSAAASPLSPPTAPTGAVPLAPGPSQSILEQLAADPSPVPAGMGAVFVLALTDATLEPAVDLSNESGRVASGAVGAKVFVPPGHYVGRVGRGSDRVRPQFECDVTEGEVTPIVPTWGALTVDVVDEHGVPHRGSYDLILLDTREAVGTGRGADRRTGEGLRTWLLRPGVYKIVQPGGTYRDRVDFATVRVMASEVIRFTLVIDEATGTFRGGGVTTGIEPTKLRGAELRGSFGGAFDMTQRSNVPGAQDGMTFGGNLFVDFDVLYNQNLHFFSSQLQLEAGMLLFPGENDEWRKTLDYGEFAAIYILQLHPLIGPFVRLSYDTHLIPGYDYFEEPTDVLLFRTDGDVTRLDGVDRVALGPSFSQNRFQEGVGGNWRALRSYYLDLDIRLGVGFDQLLTRDLYVLEDDADTVALEYEEKVPFAHREGVNLGIAAAGNLTGWLSYNLEFELLEPFVDWQNPIVDLELTVTLRLLSVASLHYVLRVRRDIETLPAGEWAQVDQHLLLRFALNLF